MATIQNIVATFRADSTAFERGTNRARNSLRGFSRGMTASTAAARRWTRGLLMAAGVGGLGYMLKQQMEAIDKMAKLSDRIGMQTGALAGLQHGAELSGVQHESLNKSLEIFTRRLGEVEMGTGEAKHALSKLGLSYTDLINVSPEEALGIVADQLKMLETQAEKAAAANYLFGRSGQQLVNLFETGSEGIKKYREEAELLGLTFSRFDAAKIEAANDSLTRTKSVFTGLFRQTAIELAPYIEAASTAFVDFATQGEGVGKNITGVFEQIALSVAKVGEETESLVIGLGKLKDPLDYSKKVSEANKKAIEQYRAMAGDPKAFTYPGGLSGLPIQPREPGLWNIISKKQMEWAGLVVSDRSSIIRAAFNKIRENAERAAVSPVKVGLPGETEKEPGLAAITTDVTAAMSRMYGQMGKISKDSYKDRVGLLEDEKKKYIDAKIEENAINEWYTEQRTKLDIQYYKEAGTMADGFRAAGMQIRREMKSWSERAYDFSMSMQGSFSSGLENMARDLDNWGDHFKNILNEIYWSAMRIALFEPAGAALAGSFSSGFSSLFGGGGGGAVTAPNPSASPTMPDYSYPQLQHGGEILQSGLAYVHKGETVTPGKQNLSVILNNSGPPMQYSSEPKFDGEKLILNIENVLADRISRNAGPLVRHIKGRA